MTNYPRLSETELNKSLARAWDEGYRAGMDYHSWLSHWSAVIRPYSDAARPRKPSNPYGAQR